MASETATSDSEDTANETSVETDAEPTTARILALAAVCTGINVPDKNAMARQTNISV